MQLNFWQLSRDLVERVVSLIAGRTRASGEKLLVVDADPARRKAIGRALGEKAPEAFLANGDGSEPRAARQPILLSPDCEAANGARYAVIADGEWRDGGETFERTILLFDETGTPRAREIWRKLDGREGVARSYYAQESGQVGQAGLTDRCLSVMPFPMERRGICANPSWKMYFNRVEDRVRSPSHPERASLGDLGEPR